MGKRSDFERKPRDLYETPPEAVQPLLPHLCPQTRFIEPCAGAGALVDALQAAQSGERQADIAERLGVSRSTISAISTGRAWRETK